MSEKSGLTPEEVQSLAVSVDAMAQQAAGLRAEVGVIDEKSKRDRKILGMLLAVLAAVVILGGLNYWRVSTILDDCNEPGGACTEQAKVQGDAVVEAVRFRAEIERLRSEIAIAQRKEQFGDVVLLRERLETVQKQSDYQDQVNQAQIAGEPIPPPPSGLLQAAPTQP